MAKRLLALLVALFIATGMITGCKKSQTNTASGTDTNKNVTLKIMAGVLDGSKPPDQTWQWAYLKKNTGVNFEVQYILNSDLPTQKSLILASNSLPDIFYGFSFTNAELTKYGDTEKQFASLTKNINKNDTPHINAWFDAYPDAKAACVTTAGNMYTLPAITADTTTGDYAAGVYTVYMNQNWLKTVGMSTPKTLDEFTAILKAFKEKNPGNVPANKNYPAGGLSGPDDISLYILNALGYNVYYCRQEALLEPCLRDNQVVIPVGDQTYLQYLTIMNQYYKEGLISPDYFTMDYKASRAMAAAGNNGVYTNYTLTTISTDFNFVKNWIAISPLTSKYRAKAGWCSSGKVPVSTGNFVISSTCKDIKTALKFADFFFTDKACVTINSNRSGAMKGSDDTLGMIEGWSIAADGSIVDNDYNNNKLSSVMSSYTSCGNARGTVDGKYNTVQYAEKLFGLEPTGTVINTSITSGYLKDTSRKNVVPYLVDPFPRNLYYTTDVSSRMTDLQTVLKTYALSETAKFITGKRDLSTFNAYIDELKKIGLTELQGYYKDAYNSYQKSKK